MRRWLLPHGRPKRRGADDGSVDVSLRFRLENARVAATARCSRALRPRNSRNEARLPDAVRLLGLTFTVFLVACAAPTPTPSSAMVFTSIRAVLRWERVALESAGPRLEVVPACQGAR